MKKCFGFVRQGCDRFSALDFPTQREGWQQNCRTDSKVFWNDPVEELSENIPRYSAPSPLSRKRAATNDRTPLLGEIASAQRVITTLPLAVFV